MMVVLGMRWGFVLYICVCVLQYAAHILLARVSCVWMIRKVCSRRLALNAAEYLRTTWSEYHNISRDGE